MTGKCGDKDGFRWGMDDDRLEDTVVAPSTMAKIHGEETPPHRPSSSIQVVDDRMHDDGEANLSIERVEMETQKYIGFFTVV